MGVQHGDGAVGRGTCGAFLVQLAQGAALVETVAIPIVKDLWNAGRVLAKALGITPGGKKLHNGMDSWWDDEGEGNCWEGNRSSRGEHTNNFVNQVTDCPDGSPFTPGGSAVKDAGFLSCSQYDRNDPTFRHPPECNWFDSPPKPTATCMAPMPPRC